MKWRKLNGQAITEPIIESVEKAILREKNDGHQLKVCIGTDSEVHGKHVEFATVILFLRAGKGGFMFISNSTEIQKMSLKERMISEVAKSVEVAYSLCHLFDRYNVALEVHADINSDPNFKSNVALREAMGYILGMGFQFKSKPNAVAATNCADKFC